MDDAIGVKNAAQRKLLHELGIQYDQVCIAMLLVVFFMRPRYLWYSTVRRGAILVFRLSSRTMPFILSH